MFRARVAAFDKMYLQAIPNLTPSVLNSTTPKYAPHGFCGGFEGGLPDERLPSESGSAQAVRVQHPGPRGTPSRRPASTHRMPVLPGGYSRAVGESVGAPG